MLSPPTGSPAAPLSRRSTSVKGPLLGLVLSLGVLGLLFANATTGGAWLRALTGQLSSALSAAAGNPPTGFNLPARSWEQPGRFSQVSRQPAAWANLSQHVAAVVLDVENRPDQQQEQPSVNPANPSAAATPFQQVKTTNKVPFLTPQQAEQVFDSPQDSPLIPPSSMLPGNRGIEDKQPVASQSKSKLSRPAVRRTPWATLPLHSGTGQIGTEEQAAISINPEADLDVQSVDQMERLPLESTTDPQAAGSELATPLVPLDHPDWATAHPELLDEAPAAVTAPTTSAQPAAAQLAPSNEITPLEPLPLRPAAAATETLPTAAGKQPASGLPNPVRILKPDPAVAATEKSTGPWPRPEFLLNRLEEVTTIPGLEPWVQKTRELLIDLHAVPQLGDRQVVTILGELEQQTVALEPLVIRFSTVSAKNADEALGPESVALRRLAYKLRQQIDVWYATHEFAVRNFQSWGDVDPPAVVQGLQVSRRKLSLPGVSPEWQRYLVLDQVDTAFNSLQTNPQEQRAAARRFLSRLHSPILSETQQQFLAEQVDAELVEQLKVAAREEVHLEQLLTGIEALQENRNGVAQHRVNQLFQNLAWQDDPAARELAATLDTHFRNANFRVSVSAEMLNLLLPDAGETHEPVNENVLGAEVRGQSRVANRLQIRLIPDTSRIQMRLEAIGKVLSQTEAQRSGFTVQNVGDARFQVFKRLAIGREGITADQPEAWSRASNRMVGMQSELDGVPVLGWVARRIAERKIAEQTPQVERYTRRKLETAIKQRFNTEIERQLSEMQQYLYSNMIQPLTALELEPTPLEMRSTDERVIMRYRLAGFDQMGGSTARPRGLQNSLLSMQIHETSINNLLNRIDLNGEEFTADELTSHLANVFGWQSGEASQAHDATFEFAHFDPIRVTFSQGSAAVQLNLKRLRIGNGKTWKNLTATCNFIPQSEGGKIIFVQDGSGVALSGHRLGLRDQVAVRAIFTALFKDQYELPILPKNIAQKLGPSAIITQLELNDGWIGLSVDKRENLNSQRISELEIPRSGGR